MKHTVHDKIITGFSFFAGMGIAAAALIGYGFMTPFWGSGFAVKQIYLLVIMAALATGSFTGAMVSEYKRNDKILLLSILASGLLILLLPFYASWINWIPGYGAGTAFALVYGFLVLYLPISCIAQVIPLTIAGLKVGSVGTYARKTGIVFAIVMLGIAFGSALYLWWLIPAFGLIGSAFLTGFLLILIPAIQIFRQGWRKPGIFSLTLAILLPFAYRLSGTESELEKARFNRISENWSFHSNRINLDKLWYVNLKTDSLQARESILHQILDNSFPGTEVLFIGCNDGSLLQTSAQNKLSAVFLDPHPDLIRHFKADFDSVKDFHFSFEKPRLFLNQKSKPFDLILIDLMRGEDIPAELYTAETFLSMRNRLKPGGLGIVLLPETPGNAAAWYGTRSLYKTIRTLGFFAELSHPQKNEPAMILFSGSRDAFDDRLDEMDRLTFYNPDSIQVNNVRILTDNRPFLDLYYSREMRQLRQFRAMQ